MSNIVPEAVNLYSFYEVFFGPPSRSGFYRYHHASFQLFRNKLSKLKAIEWLVSVFAVQVKGMDHTMCACVMIKLLNFLVIFTRKTGHMNVAMICSNEKYNRLLFSPRRKRKE